MHDTQIKLNIKLGNVFSFSYKKQVLSPYSTEQKQAIGLFGALIYIVSTFLK